MSKRSRKTPQLVSVNRAFLLLGLFGVLAMAIYYYWDRNHQRINAVSSHQTSR
jgi:hypothetical protein